MSQVQAKESRIRCCGDSDSEFTVEPYFGYHSGHRQHPDASLAYIHGTYLTRTQTARTDIRYALLY